MLDAVADAVPSNKVMTRQKMADDVDGSLSRVAGQVQNVSGQGGVVEQLGWGGG